VPSSIKAFSAPPAVATASPLPVQEVAGHRGQHVPGGRLPHRLETEAPYAQIVSGQLENAKLEVLDGEEGEIEPGLRWIRTPGHSDGLITLLVDTDEGLVAIASDCVGPLPEYFDRMELPEDFGPEREELLRQWRRIRELKPHVVIPGHNPPVVLD
jgi:glyoxylase-like metal-dependent hydrolase (beta-lactamase superfamily II)